MTVRHPALHRHRLAQPVFLPGARCWGAGGGRPWQFHPGLTPAVCHSGLPIAASEQAARGENCVGPQYNSQYNRKAQEAPEFSKRCLRRQTSRGIANLGGAKSRGPNLPSATWGATGACFYSYTYAYTSRASSLAIVEHCPGASLVWLKSRPDGSPAPGVR